MNTLVKAITAAILIAGLAAIVILMALWNGWAVWTVWNWWAPVIGSWVPVITYAGAVGLSAIVGCFTWPLAKSVGSKNVEKTTAESVGGLLAILAAPAIIVAGNWLILAVLV